MPASASSKLYVWYEFVCPASGYGIASFPAAARRPRQEAPPHAQLDVRVPRIDRFEGRAQLERLRVGDRRRLVGLRVRRLDEVVRVDLRRAQHLLRLAELVHDAEVAGPARGRVVAPALTRPVRGPVRLGELQERVVRRLRLERLLQRGP